MAACRTKRSRIRNGSAGRKQLLGRLIDVELSIRRDIAWFWAEGGPVTRKNFEARIRELVVGMQHWSALLWQCSRHDRL
jgi:hypothetical protein